MSKWTSIQVNNQYVHVCTKCNDHRNNTDVVPGEISADWGMDKYVHYTSPVTAETYCGSKDMVE